MANSSVVYISKVRVERIKGPHRRVHLPVEGESFELSTHDEIAAYYGHQPEVHPVHSTTLDYLVAATAGWLTGTLGGALEARDIPAGEGRLTSEATGEIETDEKILVIRRIHVKYHLKLEPRKREAAERAHKHHARFCPVARTIRDCVEITTSLEMEDL